LKPAKCIAREPKKKKKMEKEKRTFLLLSQLINGSNVRLKGGFARTRRWVLSINEFTD
jgi:hypothetical protein